MDYAHDSGQPDIGKEVWSFTVQDNPIDYFYDAFPDSEDEITVLKGNVLPCGDTKWIFEVLIDGEFVKIPCKSKTAEGARRKMEKFVAAYAVGNP